MSFFLKRSRGSVTVLVTLILIPTIFFTGFMTDLARVKLYGNQAVMAADDYGDAVLSYYDNVLKELYGLFSVTQSDEGLAAIAELENYMKTSFDPTSNTVSWSHLGGIFNTDLSGFTPYSSATLSFSYTAAEGANLANNDVLSTQIGDFMKFRIAQVLLDGDDESAVDNVIDAISTVQNTEKNAEAIEQRNELYDLVSDAYETAQKYYETLEKLNSYPSFLSGVNSAYKTARSTFVTMKSSSTYTTYYNYTKNETAILEAVAKKKRIEEAEKKKSESSDDDDEDDDDDEEEVETLTAQEEAYIAMYEAYQADTNARKSKIKSTLDSAISTYKQSWDSDPVDFDNFASLSGTLVSLAGTLSSQVSNISQKRSELEETLKDSSISSEVRDGMEDELALLDELFKDGGSYSAQNYVNLANYIAGNSSRNSSYKTQASNLKDTLEQVEKQYLNCESSVTSLPAEFSYSDYQNFQDVSKYKNLYDSLKDAFGSEGSSEDEKKAKKAKAAAEDAQKEAEETLKESESTSARDIPSSFGFGSSGSGNDFAITKLIKTAASYFTANSFAEAGNELLLKVYTVEYDFGMFSSRVTNVSSDDDSSSEKATSLTGYEMSKKINYLYGAELEYLFGGYNSSTENLNSAKNKILAFRAVMNFTATYTVGPVDTAIKAVADAAAVVNPLLGFAVSGALRLAVAGIETAADWELLKSGESVPLMKTETGDLTGLDSIASLLGVTLSDDKSDGIELDYEQYLMIMLLFMTTSDELTERTGNLICLNVNTVEQGISESGTLSTLKFTMDKAVTAINASCQIHLDFVIMQNGFAQQVVDSDTYAEVEAFEKNSYKFTVTRGY